MAFRIPNMGFLGQAGATASLHDTIAAKEIELANLRTQRMALEDELARVKGLPPPVRPGRRVGPPGAAPPPAGLPELPLGLTWGQVLIAGAGVVFVLMRGRK